MLIRHIPIGAGASAIAAVLLVSGCAVGPDFLRPAAPAASGYTQSPLPDKTASADTVGGAAQSFKTGGEIPAQWWTLFASKPLNALIEQALKANPDIEAAEASLREAQQNVYAGEGVLFPAVDVNASSAREKFSPAAFGGSAPSSIFTLYNSSVSVSYGIDIFGGTTRELESLRAQADAQRFQLEAAHLTISANVVTAAVQEASLYAQVRATQAIIDIQQHQLTILQKQLKLGAVPKSAVLAQQSLLAQTQAALPPLQKQLAQQHTLLAALTGHFPNAGLDDDFELADLHLPEDVPVSLPSKLIEQRPDIRVAEAQLHSASAEIGVATANMLPQITLSSGYGWEGTHFSREFSPTTNIWNLGAGLAQPIFHGGELLYQRRAAIEAYHKADAQYRSTVLQAFRNVADALRALEYDAAALAAQANAERAASGSLDLAQTQFKAGAISYMSLLDAERADSQARIALVQAQAARFADTAALFQALGGGWWNAATPVSTTSVAQDSNKPVDADKLCTVNKTDPAQSLPDSQGLSGEPKQ